jgi:tRNA dimethylallyltransferase
MDSMQIYRHMDIGTAKSTAAEQNIIQHHLIDIIEPTSNYSVSLYKSDALECVKNCLNRGHLPVFCGGTGQYASALAQGISFVPIDIDPDISAAILLEANVNGYDSLYNELILVDPVSAGKIHPNNKKRIIRAIEIYRQTGKTMSYFNELSIKEGPQYPFSLFAINWDRSELYSRMDLRVDQMLDAGLLDEVRNLRRLGLEAQHTSMQAIGYKELFEYLDGRINYNEAVSLIKQKTRNYGKRQLTWFRNMGGVIWINPCDYITVLKMIEV